MGARLVLVAAAVASSLAACTPFLSVGVDRTQQASARGVGWHLGFGIGGTYEPRQKQAVSILASRRVDVAGGGGLGYGSDGWELRGDLDLPRPNYRLTAAVRRAGIYDTSDDNMNAQLEDRQVWGGYAGLTRYWPRPWQVVSLSVGPTVSHVALDDGDAWTFGAEARFQYVFDGFQAWYRACKGVCVVELAHMKPSGYVSGNYSWFTAKPNPQVCSQQGGTDQYGVARPTWKCY